jgi:hypothetical protein
MADGEMATPPQGPISFRLSWLRDRGMVDGDLQDAKEWLKNEFWVKAFDSSLPG